MAARLAAGVLIAMATTGAPAHAQTYLQYRCDDGAQISVAFVDGAKAAYVQLDGKAMILPKRFSTWGSRYKKSGVALWVKRDDVRLKRPKSNWTQCKAS